MEKMKPVPLKVPDYVYKGQHEENICLKMIHNLCKDGDYDILILKVKLIDQTNARNLYQFGLQFVKTSVTFKEFLSVLQSYEHVAVGITKADSSIIGMIVYGAKIDIMDGKPFNLLKTALGFVDSKYQGSIFYSATAAYFILRELLLHPTIPLYNIAKCFSYKSYMVAVRHYKTIYPKQGVEMPERERKIIAQFAKNFETHQIRFINSTNVIQQGRTKISRGVADISDRDLTDPNIKFFCEENPGWHEGHELIAIARVTWEDVANLIQKAAKRSQSHSYASNPKSKL